MCFTWIAQLLNEHLMGEGASRKSEWVLLLEGALGAFHALKQACMSAPILAFTDYTQEWKQMLPRRGWKQYFPKSRQMGDTTQSPMVAEPSQLMKRITILPNLSFWH